MIFMRAFRELGVHGFQLILTLPSGSDVVNILQSILPGPLLPPSLRLVQDESGP